MNFEELGAQITLFLGGVGVSLLTLIGVLRKERMAAAKASANIAASHVEEVKHEGQAEEIERLAGRIKAMEDREQLMIQRMEAMTQAALDTDRHVMLLEMIFDILAQQYGIDIDAVYAKYGVTRRFGKK